MKTETVPARFLGFAFSFADLLLELDEARRIRSLDGAVSLLGGDTAQLTGRAFETLMDADDAELFRSALQIADPRAPRIGPLAVALGPDGARRRFVLFATGLFGDGRLFMSLACEHRLGAAASQLSSDPADQEQGSEAFLKRLDRFFEDYPAESARMQMTLVDVDPAQAGEQAMHKLMRLMGPHAAGGDMIGQLSDTRLAVLHNQGEDAEGFVHRAAASAGVDVNAVALNSGQGGQLQAELILHSMREAVRQGEDLDLTAITQNYQKALSDNVDRARQFRATLDNRDFTLAYQPIVTMQTGQIHHFEALARFSGTQDSPFKTIQFAEEIGLIADFDLAVVQAIAAQVEHRHPDRHYAGIAVNLSGKSLSLDSFCSELIGFLMDQQGLVRHLSFEITESSRIEDLTRLNRIVQQIRHMGYLVYLDDFGAGASGFQYLRQLKVDGVKIDGPYVRDAVGDHEAQAFLRAMVSLCRDLKMSTVAEWVENDQQASLLRDAGVDYGQGFLFGRPRPFGAARAGEDQSGLAAPKTGTAA